MTEPRPDAPTVLIAELSAKRPYRFEIVPEAEMRAALARDLGIEAVRKLRFTGTISAEGRRDWRLDATLGATVVQPCVVTLAPVTTRIEAQITRRYLAEPPALSEDAEGEIEMPEDDTVEELGSEIDLGAVLHEALALNLPLYPRVEDADLGEAVFAAPGVAPMRDEDAKPFAGLADLRSRLAGKADDEGAE